ncbi:hypothetical protein LJ737_26635, partial [Hymenobacter sp. 15J16-1T3B]|uniref:hypothetical protein n=1 Tax=Hymenobacter sp. 15J16-1T3B TaxID=2886941 RepID=UPI001D11FE85
SNADGLFTGRIQNSGEKLLVNEKALLTKSIRTAWSSYDVLNYDTQNNFTYFKNEVEKPKTERRTPYSSSDEESSNVKITNFGVESFKQENILPPNIKQEDIKYSFNSSNYCFFVTKNGKITSSSIIKEKETNQIHISSRAALNTELNAKVIGPTKVISSAIIPKGCVIEFISSTVIIKENKLAILTTEPAYAVKTFPASKRFKNIILTFDKNGVTLFSFYPFETKASNKHMGNEFI